MKNLSLLFAAFLLIQLCTIAQTNWTKYANNPVLPFGLPGSWDEGSSEFGSVLFDGNIYHMWYSGNDGAIFRIGYATSPDGIIWTKDTQNNPIVDLGLPGRWDDAHVYLPCVLLVDTTFHMWYAGHDGSKERIGHATSPDGVEWTKDTLNNPVMDVGLPGRWDDTEVFPGPKSILFDGSIYKMWYGGFGVGSNNMYKIGLATSPNGINWEKDTSNPVMGPGLLGSWDGDCVLPSTVIFDGTTYHSWYSGCTECFIKWQIGYATSSNGIDWEKDTLNNPVLEVGPFGSWDNASAWYCSVIFDTVYKMWYSGGEFGSGRIGYAYILPSAPILISPIGSVDSTEIEFIWTSSYPAIDRYWFEIAANNQFTNSFIDSTITDTTYLYSNINFGESYWWRVKAHNFLGWGEFSDVGSIVVVSIEDNQLPIEFNLEQNYPNPFNPMTIIKYQIPEISFVTLKVFDLLGNEIASLVNEEKPNGSYEVEFNSHSSSVRKLTSGVYFYQLKTRNYLATKKMILIK